MKIKLHLPLGLLALACWVWPAASGMAGFDGFLYIPGAPGESSDSGHKDWIELNSWSWGEAQTGTLSLTNQPQFQPIVVTKVLDKASPMLMLFCMKSTNLAEVDLQLRHPGGTNAVVFLTITLKNVIITSVNGSGDSASAAVPTESLSLNFTKIEMVYQAVDGTGAPSGGPVTASWDQSAGTGTISGP